MKIPGIARIPLRQQRRNDEESAMMRKDGTSFHVVTDTSANLPTALAAERGITVIPFAYIIAGEAYTCTDTDAFDAEGYYAMIGSGVKVTTSQVAPQQFVEAFEPLLADGDVIYLSMASGISGTYNSACMAARQLAEKHPERKVCVIDTKGASLGTGLIALRAADLRDQGTPTDEAVAALEKDVMRMYNVFTVDNLMYLRRTGRLSNLSAAVGTVLNIKPLLKGSEEAKIVAFAKVRGRNRAIRALAERYDRLAVNPEQQIIGISQSACREDAAYLESLIRQNRPPKQILQVEYEPVTGSHVGPGALALFFLGGDDVRKEN